MDQEVSLAVQLANDESEADLSEYEIGDIIQIQTGRILDNNGNPVTNNTQVTFTLTTISNNEIINQRELDTTTKSGIASINTTLDNAGTLTISGLISDNLETQQSRIEIIDISTGSDPTETPATDNNSPDSNLPDVITTLAQGEVSFWLWVILVIISLFISFLALQVGINTGQVRWGIRNAFTSFIGGLLLITVLSSGLAYYQELLSTLSLWEVVIITIIASLLGWLAGILWRLFSPSL